MNFTSKVKANIKNYDFERSDDFSAFAIGFLSATGYVYKNVCKGNFQKNDEFLIEKGEALKLDDFYFAPKLDENYNYVGMDFISDSDIREFIIKGDLSVRKSYLKGAFLSAGSITDPKKAYHFEISMANKSEANFLQEVLKSMEIDAKFIERKNQFVVYVKEGAEISDILTMLGAINETLYFEDQMVIKSARNDTNRRVNCETANLSKTVNAGVRQIAAIEKLKESGKIETLDETLYDVALLRMANPDATLSELAKLYGNGISKSGINHRLKKIMELAEEL